VKSLKNILLVLFLLILLFSQTACRVRIIETIIETEYEPTVQALAEPEPEQIHLAPEELETEYESEPEQEQEIEQEPVETAPEISPIAYVPIYIETQTEAETQNPSYGYLGYEPLLVATLSPPEEYETEYITIETPSYAPTETTLYDQGDGTLGLIVDRYTGVLNRGLGSLFECQRVYVYFERLAEFHTVNRTFAEHNLIINSGGFNAAARRANDALIVDTDWIVRRNPAVIIRLVDSTILGGSITDTTRAAAIRNEILSREGFESISAVLHRQVLLISEELMTSDEGQLIAKISIAHVMYPTLFEDINLANVYSQIVEAGGLDYSMGIFVY